MNLPPIPRDFKEVPATVAQWKRLLEQADARNMKQGTDIFVGRGARAVILSPNGTQFQIVVADDGTLSAVAL